MWVLPGIGQAGFDGQGNENSLNVFCRPIVFVQPCVGVGNQHPKGLDT